MTTVQVTFDHHRKGYFALKTQFFSRVDLVIVESIKRNDVHPRANVVGISYRNSADFLA